MSRATGVLAVARWMRCSPVATEGERSLHLVPPAGGATLCGRPPLRRVGLPRPDAPMEPGAPTRLCGTCERVLRHRIYGFPIRG